MVFQPYPIFFIWSFFRRGQIPQYAKHMLLLGRAYLRIAVGVSTVNKSTFLFLILRLK